MTSTAMSRFQPLTFLGLIQPRLTFGTVSAVRTDCGSITAAGGVAEIAGLRMSGLPGPPECLLSQSGGTTRIGGLARRSGPATRQNSGRGTARDAGAPGMPRLTMRPALAGVHLWAA